MGIAESVLGAVSTADSANSSSSSGGAADVASGAGGLADVLSLGIVSGVQTRLAREQQQAQFDKQFEENARTFGLTFALKEWATRKGMDIQQAQQLYNQSVGREQLGIQKAQAALDARAKSQQTFQEQEKFRWAIEDRDKATRMNKAFAKGITQGVFGRV